jgi:hypothetical protein
MNASSLRYLYKNNGIPGGFAARSPSKKDSVEANTEPPKQIKNEYILNKRTVNSDDFDRFRFIMTGTFKDTIHPRYEMENIHVETINDKRFIVSTDGHRLYGAEIYYDINDGNYSVEIAHKNCIVLIRCADYNFPNWKKIFTIEDLTEIGVIDLERTGLTKKISLNLKASSEFEYFVRKTEKLVNIRFLDDLVKTEWKFYESKKGEHITLIPVDNKKEMFAVIMPVGKKDSVDKKENK